MIKLARAQAANVAWFGLAYPLVSRLNSVAMASSWFIIVWVESDDVFAVNTTASTTHL